MLESSVLTGGGGQGEVGIRVLVGVGQDMGSKGHVGGCRAWRRMPRAVTSLCAADSALERSMAQIRVLTVL